jgi:hypothetical protein
MMQFQLPVLPASTELKDAFAELYEQKCSGLVIVTAKGDYRLVNFDHMTEALAKGAKQLDMVHGQRLPNLKGISVPNPQDTVLKLGATIGLVNADSQRADLFSVREVIAGRLMAASSVVRCDRPGIPAGRTAQSWYHYYPPNTSTLTRPHPCVPGCNGTVR